MERVPYNETQNPNAVENLFCKELESNGEREPLNESMMSVLVALVMADAAKIEEMLTSAKKITLTISILESRSKSIGLKLDDKTLVFFGLISGTPGIAVMYCYYLAYVFKKNEKSTMQFDDIMVDVFPDGLFTDASLSSHWEAQKVDNRGESSSDNLLDYPTASESITVSR
jgi:hypothetical protein